MRDEKERLLREMALNLDRAARLGALTPEFPVPIEVEHTSLIAGPRAGVLELFAGLDAGRLKQALGKNDCAMLRQFFTWPFPGDPSCYMFGRAVRVEAAWTADLSEREVRLGELGQYPKTPGRWIAGKTEVGRTITLGMNNSTPTYLIGGTTGSGKSTFFHIMLSQLGRKPGVHRLVLIDAKYGDGLGPVSHLPGVVGPMATDLEEAKNAMCWVLAEMRRRYEEYETAEDRVEAKLPLIVVAIDEFQEFTSGMMKDAAMTYMIQRVAQQGRAALVHLAVGTHHPVQDVFGSKTTRQLLVGRVAFKVMNSDASRVLIGSSSPRADRLAGQGDAYFVTPVGVQRAQGAWLTPNDLKDLPTGDHALEEWPSFDANLLETTLKEKQVQWAYEGPELGIALIRAHLEEGRTRLIKALKEAGYTAGSVRAGRLQELARDAHRWMRENEWGLCRMDEDRVADEREDSETMMWRAFLEEFDGN